MSSESEEINFRKSRIPERLAPAADVTEEEYRAAKVHQMGVLLLTGGGAVIGWVLFRQGWLDYSVRYLENWTMPIAGGILFRIMARFLFPKSAELKKARLRVYPEYKQYCEASEAFARDAESKRNSNP